MNRFDLICEKILNEEYKNYHNKLVLMIEAKKFGAGSLSDEEVKIRIKQWQDDGNVEARNEVVEDNMALVYNLAKKKTFSNTNVDMQQFIDAGVDGLLQSVNRFDPSRKEKFSVFLYRTVDGLMKNVLRKKHLKDLSLDAKIGDESGTTFKDTLIYDPKDNEPSYDYKKLAKVVDKLKEREQYIIKSMYGLDGFKVKNQTQIAKDLGISKMAVSKTVSKLLPKLKSVLS